MRRLYSASPTQQGFFVHIIYQSHSISLKFVCFLGLFAQDVSNLFIVAIDFTGSLDTCIQISLAMVERHTLEGLQAQIQEWHRWWGSIEE